MVIKTYKQKFLECKHKIQQWYMQSLSDAGIPVWAPKPGAQIKGELMQNKISHLIISSTQMCLQVLRHLSKT